MDSTARKDNTDRPPRRSATPSGSRPHKLAKKGKSASKNGKRGDVSSARNKRLTQLNPISEDRDEDNEDGGAALSADVSRPYEAGRSSDPDPVYGGSAGTEANASSLASQHFMRVDPRDFWTWDDTTQRWYHMEPTGQIMWAPEKYA